MTRSIMLAGMRGIGKTEFLKQLFGLLFWKQDRVAPFYYSVHDALLSVEAFSRTYLVQFLCQRLAFEKKEQALFSYEGMSLRDVSLLAEDRGASWVKTIIREYERAADPISALRVALEAPHQSILKTGIPVAILLDEFHRLKELSLGAAPDHRLVSLFDDPITRNKAPYIITGNTNEILEMPVAGLLEHVALKPLEYADALSLAQSLLERQQSKGAIPPLLVRRLGGNPLYLTCLCTKAGVTAQNTDRDFWNAYCEELIEGRLSGFWTSVFKNSFSNFSSRKIALSLCYKTYHSREPLSLEQIAESFEGTTAELETIVHGLYGAGFIEGAFGVMRPVEDLVLRDVIEALFQKEILAQPAHDLQQEFLDRLLPQKSDMTRFDLVLPMAKEAELVAAQCLDQIGKNLGFDQDTIGQLQIAVIESCINAIEHSGGAERKIYLSVIVEENRMEIGIESSGREFVVQQTGEPFGDREGMKTPGRGWGIKLMKRVADEVRFEKTARGMKTVLIKTFNKAMSGKKEEFKNRE
ncbi:MAG: ATP-binding protein [Nitrospirota bacterium]